MKCRYVCSTKKQLIFSDPRTKAVSQLTSSCIMLQNENDESIEKFGTKTTVLLSPSWPSALKKIPGLQESVHFLRLLFGLCGETRIL